MKFLSALALALCAAIAPAQQSTAFTATLVAGEPTTLELADWDPSANPPATHYFGPEHQPWHWRVPKSPYGAATQAVRLDVTYMFLLDAAGFENRSDVPFLTVSQQHSWPMRLYLPATRRAPRLTAMSGLGATYVWARSDVQPFDGVLDFIGPSGEARGFTMCEVPLTTTLTRDALPAEVARFCVSFPGDVGYVRLDLGAVDGNQNWSGDSATNPAPPYDTWGSGYSHNWATMCRARFIASEFRIRVRYYDYVPSLP